MKVLVIKYIYKEKADIQNGPLLLVCQNPSILYSSVYSDLAPFWHFPILKFNENQKKQRFKYWDQLDPRIRSVKSRADIFCFWGSLHSLWYVQCYLTGIFCLYLLAIKKDCVVLVSSSNSIFFWTDWIAWCICFSRGVKYPTFEAIPNTSVIVCITSLIELSFSHPASQSYSQIWLKPRYPTRCVDLYLFLLDTVFRTPTRQYVLQEFMQPGDH